MRYTNLDPSKSSTHWVEYLCLMGIIHNYLQNLQRTKIISHLDLYILSTIHHHLIGDEREGSQNWALILVLWLEMVFFAR